MKVTLKDFCPINQWVVDPTPDAPDHGRWCSNNEPIYLIDQTTGRAYWNESKTCVAIKCGLLAIATPFGHTVASAINVGIRLKRIISGTSKEPGMDLARIVATPIGIVGLELAAFYGVIGNPYDARKIYGSGERFLYGRDVFAPCFQPDPKAHFFGGDPSKKNAF